MFGYDKERERQSEQKVIGFPAASTAEPSGLLIRRPTICSRFVRPRAFIHLHWTIGCEKTVETLHVTVLSAVQELGEIVCVLPFNVLWWRAEVDVKCFDVDDNRQPNTQGTGHVSVMCIISLLNYWVLNMVLLVHTRFSFPRQTACALSFARVILHDQYFTIVVLGFNSLTLNLSHSVALESGGALLSIDEVWEERR